MIVDSVVDAVAVSLGPTLAVIAGNVLNYWAAKKAIRAAELAQKATAQTAMDAIEAQHAASTAAAQAADAARRLIITAQTTSVKLDHIALTGEATHKIVNNQRTIMLNLLATQAERIARENPADELAQEAARNARRDADGSPPS